MPKAPAQGIEDFSNLRSYVRNWVQPCLLGDLRRLSAAYEHNFGTHDARGQPYGAGKFLALGAVLTAGEHLGTLMMHQHPSCLFIESQRLLALSAALGGYYWDYRHLLLATRYETQHTGWPLTAMVVRLDNGRPRRVAIGLGVSDPGPHGHPHFSVHRFSVQLPSVEQPNQKRRRYDRPIALIRVFVRISTFVADLERIVADLASGSGPFARNGRQLENNFQTLQAFSAIHRRPEWLSPFDQPDNPASRAWSHEQFLREVRSLDRRARRLRSRPSRLGQR